MGGTNSDVRSHTLRVLRTGRRMRFHRRVEDGPRIPPLTHSFFLSFLEAKLLRAGGYALMKCLTGNPILYDRCKTYCTLSSVMVIIIQWVFS